MKDTGQSPYTAALEKHVHRSFILRCRINNEGERRIRLIDAQTGQQYLLDSLEELHALLVILTAEG